MQMIKGFIHVLIFFIIENVYPTYPCVELIFALLCGLVYAIIYPIWKCSVFLYYKVLMDAFWNIRCGSL